MSDMKTLHIFGVTGSIGRSTAQVVMAHSHLYNVDVVTAHSNAAELAEMAIKLDADCAILAEEKNFPILKDLLNGTGIEIACGRKALLDYSKRKADIAMMAIVGMAGLEPLMITLKHCKSVAIANKEPLVAAGPFVIEEAAKYKTKLLPVDSEHNAVFQVFDKNQRSSIERIILTASGGPFRTWPVEKIKVASKADALAHPNWDMGAKISIDSATMMNKALEVIEAHYLFQVPAEQIDVIVHPQSIIHSMIEYVDGSILAQMGASDMQTPISNILNYPNRLKTPGKTLKFNEIKALEFEALDSIKFPSVNMAYTCLKSGLYNSIAFNAANEVAVDAFLNEKINFGDIIECIQDVLDTVNSRSVANLEDVLHIDKDIRDKTERYILQGLTTKAVS